MEENPFRDLNISEDIFELLDNIPDRTHCHLCGRKRKYFCYTCLVFLNGLEDHMPKVKIPVHIDIIKHKLELDSKSTAIHAFLMAGTETVAIHTYPDIPTYDASKDILVFPCEKSMSVKEWSCKKSALASGGSPKTESEIGPESPRTIIFIDCTWNQIHPIITDSRLQDLPTVSLKLYTTKFWRPNGAKRGNECLATIEAIYYFLREFHEEYCGLVYTGEFDNLLLLFKYLYLKIRLYHGGGCKLKAYQ